MHTWISGQTWKNTDIISNLYKSLLRSQLEYCIQAGRLPLAKDIELLENVQIIATRMTEESVGILYNGRFKIVVLTTIERRTRADLLRFSKH